MKKTIKLTESDLHRIIMEAVGDFLGEPLDQQTSNEILDIAKSAKEALNTLNRKANDYNLDLLAWESAKLVIAAENIISQIETSMKWSSHLHPTDNDATARYGNERYE